MGRDERDSQDIQPERLRRDRPPTDRLNQGAGTPNDPYNPRWRSSRSNGRNRTYQSLPSSRQEFALWLQYGGWRFLLAAVVVVVVAAVLIIMSREPSPLPEVASEPTLETPREPILLQTALPTVTPSAPVTPTLELAPQQTGVKFRVEGTGAEGLFLRPQPSTEGTPLKTLPEGSEVTIIGEDEVKTEYTWKHVRDDTGSEGWAASDFLKPVTP